MVDPRTLSPQARDLVDLVDRFAHGTSGVQHAVVLSSDGLLVTGSSSLAGEHAERFAATASGVLALATTSGALFGFGGYEQTIMRFEYGFLFVTAVAADCALAVAARKDCDMRTVAFEMAQFALRCGHYLTPGVRGELRAVLAS